MEDTAFMDQADRAREEDDNGTGAASQPTEKEHVSPAKEEAAFAEGGESAPPHKLQLIRSAAGLNEEVFKICKELLRPFKKALWRLSFPRRFRTEKKLKYAKQSLVIIGDHIDSFLQHYCKASEVNYWRKMLWRFVSLFSEMDERQLQKLYKYIKNNRLDKFLQLWGSAENPQSAPRLEEKLKQLYVSWGLCKGTRDLQEDKEHQQHQQQEQPERIPDNFEDQQELMKAAPSP